MKVDLHYRPMFGVIFFIILLSSTVLCQSSGWVSQSSGTTKWLLGSDFVSAYEGWAVGDDGTILHTTNTGISWQAQASGTSLPLQSIDFINATTGWMVGGEGGRGIILQTTNGGMSWVVQDTTTVLISVKFTSPSTGWAVGYGGTLLKTTNGGTSWNVQTSPAPGVSFASIEFLNNDTGWIAGKYPATLLRTTNAGALWLAETTGIHIDDEINGLFFTDANSGWMVGLTYPDIFTFFGMIRKTTDGGRTWVAQTSNTDQELLSVGFTDQSQGWAVGGDGTVLTTTNGGTNWNYDVTGVTSALQKITVRAAEGAWIVGLNGTVLRNNLGGLGMQRSLSVHLGWNMLSVPLTSFDKRKAAIFPSATSNAFRYQGVSGYVIDDSLDDAIGYWVKFSNAQAIDIVGSPTTSASLNLTPGWNLIGGISADVPVNNIVQNPPNSIASVFGYNYLTGYFLDSVIATGKAYWVKSRNTCTITIQSSLDINIGRQFLTDRSTFTSDESPPPPPSTEEHSSTTLQLPTEFVLLQNYPNPFNPSTVLRFDLPEESDVRLAIYNALGQEVDVLFDGIIGAGSHALEWSAVARSGAPLTSGLYMYRIIAVSSTSHHVFSQTMKMVLLR